MAKVIVFGVRDLAELAHYYLSHDSMHEVVAFTVTKDHMKQESFMDLPVVAFEEVEKLFSPHDFSMIIPMADGNSMNKLRARFYEDAKKKQYSLVSYVSSKATVLTEEIGDNCFILEDNTIQPFVKVGNNVIMWSGNHIGHHSIIHDHVFITSHVVISGHCNVSSYSFLGVNATIRDGITIAEETFIAMSASITRDTVARGKYIGVYSKAK